MIKRIVSIALSVALVLSVCATYAITFAQNHSGGWSSICSLTDEDVEWINERYLKCETVEDLIYAVNKDICNEYIYDEDKQYFLGMQHFSFSDFIKSKQGLCFDFSCYLKSVFLVCGDNLKYSDDIKVYVCDVKLKSGGYHSYNFISFKDTTGEEIKYYVDITDNLYHHSNSEEYQTYYYIAEDTYQEFASNMFDDKIRNFH